MIGLACRRKHGEMTNSKYATYISWPDGSPCSFWFCWPEFRHDIMEKALFSALKSNTWVSNWANASHNLFWGCPRQTSTPSSFSLFYKAMKSAGKRTFSKVRVSRNLWQSFLASRILTPRATKLSCTIMWWNWGKNKSWFIEWRKHLFPVIINPSLFHNLSCC